jgi:hypothetical protein
MYVLGCGGAEGRVSSLMAAAAEREVSKSYFIFFVFDVPSMGRSA